MVFNTKPAPRVTQRRRTCALCFLGGGAARELAIRARRGALVMLGRCFVEERHAGERHLSFGVWPWCDVPAAASNTKPAPRVLRGAGAPVLSVSREEAQQTSLLRGRAALNVVGLRYTEGCRTGARPLSFKTRPWCDVPAAGSNTKPAPYVSPVYVARQRARYHEGEGSAFFFTVRAPCRIAFDWLMHFNKTLRRREAPLFGACPKYDVLTAVSNPKQAPYVTRRTVSREEAQHLSSSLARAVPRWF